MGDLKAKFGAIADRIDAMSVRERGLIFIAVMVVLYLIAYNVVFGPMRAEQRRLEQDLRAKQEQIRAADLQIGALFSPDGKDANAANRAKIEALTQQVKELDSQMDRMTAGVVTPKEMAKLVEQMLIRNKNLELVRLEALAPTPIDGEVSAAPVSGPAGANVTVYRHGMRVEFKGRYFDIVEYLKALEGLQWKVFWGEVSLQSDKYPISKVSVVIYTLSRYPGWIGV